MKFKLPLDKQSQNTRRLNDVKYMLESGGEVAANIHAFYETNNCLIDPLRENLVDLILKEKRQIPRGILNEIADQICTIFSTEKKRVYYEKLKNKQPTGLLWRKYKDSREKKKTESQLPSDESQTEESDALLTDEVKKSIDFLNNEDNFGVNWNKSTISEHWTTTFLYRDSKVYKNFSQALDDWLPLRRADAPALIHCDFELKYGSDSAQSLLTKWENFTFRNQQEILRGIRDAKEKKVLQAAQCGTDLNAKNRTFVMALHQLSYTVPAHTTSEKNKHKITWAPTIPESKDAFLVVVNDSEELDKRLKLQYRLCELKNFKIHPVIFVMGKANNTRYVIALGSIRYECESLIDAVDDAFKIYVMMKIPFPPQCARVWLFLNELFYKIDLEQKPSAKIMSMLDSYQI
ncbi:uncharacterized protein LOC119072298 [Bradysia coprophila]|uniref:uncharacterized protein LOC119072298 n=1 Tax=Bradysia coprophila TaxID=38358 RepID=UPI00187DD517|nr:uncharacterized protein LOC119072298 [Bradysia coprophila]